MYPRLSTIGRQYQPNRFYEGLKPGYKVALSVLEAGLSRTKSGRLRYNPRNFSWFLNIAKDLDGIVSKGAIDENLDSLLDEGILSAGEVEMVRVIVGKKRMWVRPYHIGNEFIEGLVQLYKVTHEEI